MAADNQPYSYYKMVQNGVSFNSLNINYCYKNSHSKAKWPVLLAFLGPCVTYTCGLLVFSCMDTNNIAFKFSPYLLPIVVHELLSNLDFT